MAYPKMPSWDNNKGLDLGKYNLGLMNNEPIPYSIYNNLHYNMTTHFNYLSNDFNFEEDTLSAPLYSDSGVKVFSQVNKMSAHPFDQNATNRIVIGYLDKEKSSSGGFTLDSLVTFPAVFAPDVPIHYTVKNTPKGATLSSSEGFVNPQGVSVYLDSNKVAGIAFDYYITLPKISDDVGHEVELLTSVTLNPAEGSRLFDSYSLDENITWLSEKLNITEKIGQESIFKNADINYGSMQNSNSNYTFSNKFTWVLIDPTEELPTFPDTVDNPIDKGFAYYKTRIFVPLPMQNLGSLQQEKEMWLSNITVYSNGTGNSQSNNSPKPLFTDRTHRAYPKYRLDTLEGYANKPNAIGLYSTGASTSPTETGRPAMLFNLSPTTVSRGLPTGNNNSSEYKTPSDYGALLQFADLENFPGTYEDYNQMFIQGGFSYPWDSERTRIIKYDRVTSEKTALKELEKYVKTSEIIPPNNPPLMGSDLAVSYMKGSEYAGKFQRHAYPSSVISDGGSPVYNKDFNLTATATTDLSSPKDTFKSAILPRLPQVSLGETKMFQFKGTLKLYHSLMVSSGVWSPSPTLNPVSMRYMVRPGTGFDNTARGAVVRPYIDTMGGLVEDHKFVDNVTPVIDIYGHSTMYSNDTRVDIITLEGRNPQLPKPPISDTTEHHAYPTTTVSITRVGSGEPVIKATTRQNDVISVEDAVELQIALDKYYLGNETAAAVNHYPVWNGALTAIGDSAHWDTVMDLGTIPPIFALYDMTQLFTYMYFVSRSPAGNHVTTIPNPFYKVNTAVVLSQELYALNLSDGSPFNPVVYKWSGSLEQFRTSQMFTITGGGSANLATGAISGNAATNRTIVEIGFTNNVSWHDMSSAESTGTHRLISRARTLY